MRLKTALMAAMFACLAGASAAQGVQTGTIRGMVKDQQDLAVPGVTVTATSPALQGARTTRHRCAGACTRCARCRPASYERRRSSSAASGRSRATPSCRSA